MTCYFCIMRLISLIHFYLPLLSLLQNKVVDIDGAKVKLQVSRIFLCKCYIISSLPTRGQQLCFPKIIFYSKFGCRTAIKGKEVVRKPLLSDTSQLLFSHAIIISNSSCHYWLSLSQLSLPLRHFNWKPNVKTLCAPHCTIPNFAKHVHV